MSCKYGRYIDEFLNGDLNVEEEKELWEHAEKCSECGNVLNEIISIDKVIQRELDEYPYRSSKAKIMERVKEKKMRINILSSLYRVRRYAYSVALVLLLIVSMQIGKSLINDFKSNNRSVKTLDEKQSFEIYLVKRGSIADPRDLDNQKDISSLILEEKPIVTEKDILLYDWNTHEIQFTNEFIEKHTISKEDKEIIDNLQMRLSGGCKLLNTTEDDRFVIVVNGKRIYSGSFPEHSYSSRLGVRVIADRPNNRIIILNFTDEYRKDGDLRTNKEIFNVLNKLKKLENSANFSAD